VRKTGAVGLIEIDGNILAFALDRGLGINNLEFDQLGRVFMLLRRKCLVGACRKSPAVHDPHLHQGIVVLGRSRFIRRTVLSHRTFLESRCSRHIRLVSCLLGLGQRWLFRGSFAIAIVAIAVALGAPSPDQWAQLFEDARQTLSAQLPR
jgi:hypothetical protein